MSEFVGQQRAIVTIANGFSKIGCSNYQTKPITMQALIAKFQQPAYSSPIEATPNRIMLFLQTGTLISGFYCVVYYSDVMSLGAYAVTGAIAGIVCGFWTEKYRW